MGYATGYTMKPIEYPMGSHGASVGFHCVSHEVRRVSHGVTYGVHCPMGDTPPPPLG